MLANTNELERDQAALAGKGVHLSSWGPDLLHGQVHVQLIAPVSTAFDALANAFRASPGPVTTDNYLAHASELLTAMYGSGLSVNPYPGTQATTFNRFDPQPYTGGATVEGHIGGGLDTSCTSSFPLAAGSYPA